MSRRTDIFIVLFLISATVSLIQASIAVSPREVAQLMGNAVGVSAGVLPNEYNGLALELKKKQEGLALLENDLAHREALLREAATRDQSKSDRQMQYLLMLTAGLFVTVLLNFYFDIRRGHLQITAPPERAHA